MRHGVRGKLTGDLSSFFAARKKEKAKKKQKEQDKAIAVEVVKVPEVIEEIIPEEEIQKEEGPQVVVLGEMAKHDIPDVDCREQNLEPEVITFGFLEIAEEEREAFEAITPDNIVTEEVVETKPKAKKKATKKKRKYTKKKKTTATS